MTACGWRGVAVPPADNEGIGEGAAGLGCGSKDEAKERERLVSEILSLMGGDCFRARALSDPPFPTSRPSNPIMNACHCPTQPHAAHARRRMHDDD